MPKRLFLFAGYDVGGLVDASLMHYVSALSKLGDVALYMDSDVNSDEIAKLSPYTIYADATHHGEYDFGSYKRAYMYAREARILPDYDFVYMVNDSVYGPLVDLKPILEKMESKNLDAFGLVCNPHREHPHIQSWFIGCRKSVFRADWFDAFMCSVTKLADKGQITRQYEQGFTKLLIEHNLSWGCEYIVAGRGVYNKTKKLYKSGMPFIKKAAFPRHHGALGAQIAYILNNVDSKARDAILENARRTWGNKYIDWLLIKNPIKIIYRNLQHMLRKVFVEGI